MLKNKHNLRHRSLTFPMLSRQEYIKAVSAKFIKRMLGEDYGTVPKKCHFITINFHDEKIKNRVSEIPALMEKLILSKKPLQNKKYYYAIEQRSSKRDEYYGFHVHLLIEKIPRAKGAIIREFFSSLKDYISDKQKIDVNLYKGPKHWRRQLDYLRGIKDDPAKQASTDNNIPFREHYSLLSIYDNN